MIPHGTIERLEHLLCLIDIRKDDQDERIQRGISYGPDYEIDEQLLFPPPLLTEGSVTENALYQWLAQLELIYEALYRRTPALALEYLSVYREHPLRSFFPEFPPLTPEGKEELRRLLEERKERNHAEAAGPIVVADEGADELASECGDEAERSAPRFKWPEEE